MKSVVATARKSVHFHDSLDKYLTVKMEAMDENNIDYHTPILKRKDGLAMADKSYGPHSRRHTEAAVQPKTMICKGMSVKFQRAQLMGYDSPEEYEKREVLHYAPDANGSVGKYMLPENEVRRAVAKAALTMARPRKRKADLPDSPEGNTVRDSKIESPSPKRVRKKSKATHMRAPAKAKPPRMVPGNNSQGDDVVSGTPDNDSPVSSGSLSPILPSRIEPLDLLKPKATHTHALAKAKPPRMRPGNSSQVDRARLPQNEVTGAQEDEVVPETVSPSNSSPLSSSKTVPESHTSMVIPPIGLIHPTPNSTPARGQSMSGSNNNGITYLTVNEGPTPWARSETPSSTTSTGAVHSEALLKGNVKCLVEIDIIKLPIDKKVPPPETLDTAQHWEIVRDVGDELRGKGADVGRLARAMAKLLDTDEVSDKKDEVLNMWIQMLPG
ncbi:uncharacterized protein EI90DRAFT_3019245 [Cantharellus anzutake]|uniref:uncharacterized protein n=1 Tax=Cantharellus anzutake TaxID=1750568 RepID=UPI001908C80C|nr:uncharacterized protein EI90DRAFT_3019245 [Cantharellus anzutake]KAF8325056.1 hypothetical protein EI90DRAFT_3019245 [Cantharellus anzutake]